MDPCPEQTTGISSIETNQVSLTAIACHADSSTSPSVSQGHNGSPLISKDSNLPMASEDEDTSSTRWWENNFFKRVKVQEILNIAASKREGEHKCRFGTRKRGAYNVIIFLRFDDGVEWVAKMPTIPEDGETNLDSEYATLLFLQKVGGVPVPKVHGACFDQNNATKSPYFFMDKVDGVELHEALKKGMSRKCVYETLRQLAQVRKTLARHPFCEIGSLTTWRNHGYVIDRQLNIENRGNQFEDYKHFWGPFESSFEYYANLHHISWYQCQRAVFETEARREKFKIHAHLAGVLDSYVGKETGTFFLAHTDLHTSNILVDPNTGSITGIIDWDFASTFPPRAAEHYPLFLAQKDRFVKKFKEMFDDPVQELMDWRRFYADQFTGDAEMEEYLKNIDSIVTFESILHDYEEATLENLVEACKFLESPSTVDRLLPLTSPTQPHDLISAVSNSGLEAIPVEIVKEVDCMGETVPNVREVAVQTDTTPLDKVVPHVMNAGTNPSMLTPAPVSSDTTTPVNLSSTLKVRFGKKVKGGLSWILRICSKKVANKDLLPVAEDSVGESTAMG